MKKTLAHLKREQTNCKDGGWEGWVQKTGKAMKTKQKTLQNFGRPGQYSISILEKS